MNTSSPAARSHSHPLKAPDADCGERIAHTPFGSCVTNGSARARHSSGRGTAGREHFRNRDGRDGETQPTNALGLEQRLKARRVPRMLFEKVDDRRRASWGGSTCAPLSWNLGVLEGLGSYR